jgi:hypothetical protein
MWKHLTWKSKTKNKSNIQDNNKRNNKIKSHIPNGSIKSKTPSVKSKCHLKVHCVKHKISKRKHNVYKIHTHNQNKER